MYRPGIYREAKQSYPVGNSDVRFHKGQPRRLAMVLVCGHAVTTTLNRTKSRSPAGGAKTKYRCEICTREEAAKVKLSKQAAATVRAKKRTGKKAPSLSDMLAEHGAEAVLEALVEMEKKGRLS